MSRKTTENKDKDLGLENLLGKTDPVLDAQVREKLISARVGLLLKAPFFGSMATRLELVNADEWLPTAATDGRKFYYNSRFVDKLKIKEIEFLFGHEVLHCCYDHINRAGERDKQLFNAACDYAVNRDLVKHRVGIKITTVPCLYDLKYNDMSAEEIYDVLYENADKIDLDSLIKQMLDEHLEGNQGSGDAGEGDGDNEGIGPTSLSNEEKEEIKNEIKEAMMQASQAAGAGNTPEGIERIIQEFTEPKMNWRELLRQSLESTIKEDFSWMRPSRRGWHMDAILPGMTPGEEVDIAIAIDTSGSIYDSTLKDFLNEVNGIMDTFTSFKIHLFTFDTKVHNPQVFNSDNLDDIADYQIYGHGGTDFNCVFKYLLEEGIEPQRLVMFTDMYPWDGEWGDSNYCDTLFIAHGTTSIEAPYGTTVYFDEAA
jgi:predicted metal-dependent peptidase